MRKYIPQCENMQIIDVGSGSPKPPLSFHLEQSEHQGHPRRGDERVRLAFYPVPILLWIDGDIESF